MALLDPFDKGQSTGALPATIVARIASARRAMIVPPWTSFTCTIDASGS
jgi:hypothetical protein